MTYPHRISSTPHPGKHTAPGLETPVPEWAARPPRSRPASPARPTRRAGIYRTPDHVGPRLVGDGPLPSPACPGQAITVHGVYGVEHRPRPGGPCRGPVP